MPVNDNDKLLVNDGSKTETITFAQFKDGAVLNDSDKFLINDGTKTETITWAEIEDELGPKGIVNKPTVLKPKDGVGSGDLFYLKTDKITKIEGGGIKTCETDLIQSVEVSSSTESLYIMDREPTGLQDILDNGTVWISGQSLSTGSYIIRVNNEGVKDGGYLFASNPNGDLGLQSPANGVAYDQFGNTLADKTQSYSKDEWTKLEFSPNLPDPNDTNLNTGYYKFYTHPGVAYQVFLINGTGVDIIGVTIAPSLTDKKLTFPSSNGFDCFEPGDVVQDAWDQRALWREGFTRIDGDPANSPERAFDAVYDNNATDGGSKVGVLFTPPIPLTGELAISGANQGHAATIVVTHSGGSNSFTKTTENEVWSVLGTFTGVTSISLKNDVDNSSYISGIRLSGKRLIDSDIPGPSPEAIKVINKDADAKTINVDGGNWTGSDGSGTPDSQTKLVKETPYDTTLTVDGPTDLADMTGSVLMTNGTGTPGPYTQTPYKLVTTDIESVADYGAWNQTQTWSAVTTGTWDKAVTFMFDGDESTQAYPTTNVAGTITFELKVNSKLEFLGYSQGEFADCTWYFKTKDGGTYTFGKSLPYPFANKGWIDTASLLTPPFTIVEIGTTNHQGGVSAVRVDGQVLVNPGITGEPSTDNKLLTFPGDVSTNPDLQYFRTGDQLTPKLSITVETSDKQFYTARGADKGFDGLNYTLCATNEVSSAPLGSDWNQITFNTPLKVTTAINIAMWSADHGQQVSINRGTYQVLDNAQTEFAIPFTGELNSLRFSSISTNSGSGAPDRSASFSRVGYDGNYIDVPDAPTQLTNPVTFEAILGDPVNVIDVNVANNTMAVDGGSWDVSNQSEVWSNGTIVGSVSPTNNWSNVFDGDTENTYVTPNTASGSTLTFASPIPFTKLEIKAGGGDVEINGNSFTPSGGGLADSVFEDVTSVAGSSQFSSIKVVDNAATVLTAIKVDNKILIDAVDDSQVWSNKLTCADGFSPGEGPELAFNGDDSTSCYTSVTATNNDTPLVFTGPIEGVTSFTIKFRGKLYFNGSTTLAHETDTFEEVTVAAPTTIDTFEVKAYEVGSTGAGISKVVLNGMQLVDPGARDFGETRVEYQTNGGQGTIVDVNTDDNTLLVANTGNRDNRWIAENKADTDFYIAGPTIVDSPLLTTNVELESSQFATTPDGVDGLKEIIWNINNVDQSAGTNNPYRPTGLPLNSEVTIKVKHVANSIGESEWSASTKFTTGASRTLRDHYMARIKELEAEVESIKDEGGQLPPSLKPTPGVRSAEDPKRARNADGTYRGDDPSTPDVNEAWEGGEPPSKGKGRKKKS